MQFEKEHIETPSEDGKRIQFLVASVQQEKGIVPESSFATFLTMKPFP